jgi:S-methylmethionine-dependent homocysteine/selenocysteine methylase
VAGSLSAFEDCYRPDLVPPADECLDEHSERIQHVLESGVDLLLIETMNSIREARPYTSTIPVVGGLIS